MDFLLNMGFFEALSYFGSLALFLAAVWGLIWFFPRKNDRGNSGPKWLILAIWLGFLGNGFNSFIWHVFADPALYYELVSYDQMILMGQVLGDFIGKGAAAVSIYLHFYARWRSLPAHERDMWSPLWMGLYPNTDTRFYRLVVRATVLMRHNALNRRLRR